MTTLQQVELGVLGPLQVRQYGLPVPIPGAKPRAILTMLGLHGGSVVSADTFVELLWGDDPPRTAAKALQTHISSLRRTLGDGFVLTEGTGWTLSTTEIDAARYKSAARLGRDAIATGDAGQAVARFDEALTLWRGIPELPDGPRGSSEKTRWIEGHAALVEDRADALLATGRAAEIVGELEAAIADAPLRERRWGHLMLALYRAGRQGEALGAYQRARSLLADELGVDPGPDLRRLEAAIVAQDSALEIPVSHQLSAVTRAVTFLLTDIEGSTAAWEADAGAMAVALARHDEIVEQVVTSRGGRLIKTRGEGDATFSVFDRPSAAAAAAIELQEAILHEPWAPAEPIRIRVALHTGEVELRDGDYFGRAVNRAARLRSLAAGGQILCSGATAELVIDSLSDGVVLADLGMRQLRNLARLEHVFELRLETADDFRAPTTDVPMERPGLPAVLAGPGPFVGRGPELERLLSAWQTTLAGGTRAVLIAGEPGVGKTRLAGEWSRDAYEQGAVVLYGRCDEDLGAPYQPFAEALRLLVPCLGANRLRGLRGVEALLPLVPGLTDALPDLAAPTRADPDTERYALFDAVVALLGVASASAPVVLILDDLHWAAKPTLLLLRHLLRFGEHARVQIVGTYRSTDLDRSHPLAAMLADLHRDGSANRLALSGLDEGDVTAYVVEAGYDDEELARALASVTGGNPFFLIEALRHVDESGGRWDASTLPQGVREAVSRRLSRLPAETNKALAAAAVVGSRFALALVESVVGEDLVDAFDEASKAGIVIEEPGGRYRFNHAIVRQSLLAELASVRRMRLHQRIATTLETDPGADDELLAELAYHYFECAWAGNAAKAVEYCRRAADQAMARLAYEGAADLYDKALHALEELDDELPNRAELQAELLVARCEALLAAGDVVSATGAVSQLQEAAGDSGRLAAWGTCFDGQLSMLTDPERLDEIESALGAAAEKLAGLEDAAGEAKAHTVRAACLARLGRIGDAETALDQALTAARRAREHRRVNAVLAGAPLAALWGPNPVPRAGGRCLDVVRLLRITTGSPVVEATSTRCQGVLDAFRGRAAAGRQLIDSARRSLTELGMRHALLEVDQFAGIVELVADDPASAEPHLRRAYAGFRRMGLDTDTAETAALLARACLALDRDAEADELCTESQHLAGHALKASIAWRTVRAQLLARNGAHEEARRVAEEAVSVAGRTDALVDHGDACLALATVLGAAGDTAGARAAANKAVELYELKEAAALAEKARSILGVELPVAPAPSETPTVEPDNACVQAIGRLDGALNREAWIEVGQLLADDVCIESRRGIVGHPRVNLSPTTWIRDVRRARELGMVRHPHKVVAVRGQRLALTRMQVGTADVSPGAPQDEMLTLAGLDEGGRIALLLFFDIEDIDAAVAELDAAHARLEERHTRAPLENAASRIDDQLFALYAGSRWDEMGALYADNILFEDRRQGLRRESADRATQVNNVRAIAAMGVANIIQTPLALRGDHLCLSHVRYEFSDSRADAFDVETLAISEVDTAGVMVARIVFDPDDIDAAFEELDARYLAGEAAPYADTWSIIVRGHAAFNRREYPATTPDWVSLDHRRGRAFVPGDLFANWRAAWDLVPDIRIYVEAVHRLSALGAVVTHGASGSSQEGFDAEWREIDLLTFDRDRLTRSEIFDETDLDAALARFDELSRPAQQLENDASRLDDRFKTYFAARDWDAMAEILAEDFSIDDRRRVVNIGIRNGRDVEIANMRAAAEIGAKAMTSVVVATRGKHLALSRIRVSGRDQRPAAFHTDGLGIVEINADNRIVARVGFDLDDIDAAFEELDARYLAGEAAAHAHTWSVIAQGYAAASRGEVAATAPDVVNIDHRQLAMIGSGELIPYLRETFNELASISTYIEAVHRLTDLGAVFTHMGAGTSNDGFDAEWRMINVIVVDGDLIGRSEVFDEVDIVAALARFDELSRSTPRLENAASQAYERFKACFAARDWDVLAEILADDVYSEDRRRVVNAGQQQGRDAVIAELSGLVEVIKTVASEAIASRGARLLLSRARVEGYEAFVADVLDVIEVGADGRVVTRVVFDPDDIDAAFEELEARYVAGEAVEYSHTWSLIARTSAAFNQHVMPPTTPDWVNIDHRKVTAFAPGDMTPYMRATFGVAPDIKFYIEAVHRLTNYGAVFTQQGRGISREGFEAEWRDIILMSIEGDQFNRCEVFDATDLDAALARFDELSRPARRLENAASRVYERLWGHYAARDWNAITEILTDDLCSDDRRRVVNAGVRLGRDVEMANLRASADMGAKTKQTAIAFRGERLVLSRVSSSNREFVVEMLNVIEIDTDNRIAAGVLFDVDDIDAAFKELDARYLADEAAGHAQTWSVIAGIYAELNRRELPETTPDWVNIDHRRGASVAPGGLFALLRAAWDVTPDICYRIEAVHRLSDHCVVITHSSKGTSNEGFDAEWHVITLVMLEGDAINHCELFDEADLDAALARFDELSRPKLETAASQASRHYWTYFATRNWDALAEMLADDFWSDDRRRMVGAGVRHGRNAEIDDLRAIADIGLNEVTTTVMATRGERLILARVRFTGDQGPEALLTEVLGLIEINADNRIGATVVFDRDDIDAAFQELDARFLAGEAAAHSNTWSVITAGNAALNRRELPPATPDCVSIDHRRGASFAPGELAAYLDAGIDLGQSIRTYIEVVHRLSDLGAVYTHAGQGVSQEGFDAEWRGIDLVTVEGNMVNRCEVFDEADINAALAKFEELSQPVPRLANAASRAVEPIRTYFAARDWDSVREIMAADISIDDRRRTVNAGIREGRDATVDDLRSAADVGFTDVTWVDIATRGEHLALRRSRFSGRDQRPEAFHVDALHVLEIDSDDRIAASVVFDLDDIDAAFAELDSRYLAGEAAAHTQTWSVISRNYAAFNRREFPSAAPDWVTIDHRRTTSFEPGGLTAYIHSTWDIAPDTTVHIEAVHRVSDLGAVITQVSKGTTQQGFEAEWREICLLTIDGELTSGCELFDETDIDAALARFEELSRPTPRLENVASQVYERYWTSFATRDWTSLAEILAADVFTDDRRRVVGGGVRRGRAADIANLRIITEVVSDSDIITSTAIATRGERLALCRVRSSEFQTEVLNVVEIDADGRIAAVIGFDMDDIDSAVEELDARYVAGEAAEHAHTWALVAGGYAASNRRELPATTPDWENVDHRRAIAFAPGELAAYMHATWGIAPDVKVYIEAVHRLSNLGAVVTQAVRGTSHEGFQAEWREITLVTVDGDLINRIELFDEEDIDAALARFDELGQAAPQLENAATRTLTRMTDAFNRRDVDGFLALLGADGRYEDRRKGLRELLYGSARQTVVHATFETAPSSWHLEAEPLAIRGSRLSLTRECYRDTADADRPIVVEILHVVDVSSSDLVHDVVSFDPDEIDAAFAELDARYLAGEAAPYAQTWSVITRAFAATNRHEVLSTTPDWVNIDHRRGTSIEQGELNAYIQSSWDDMPDRRTYVEAVHRLSNLGVVITHRAEGTTKEGFKAEWRGIDIMMVDGDLISRSEMFDEEDLEVALTRFDGLNVSVPQLENAATQIWASLADAFNRHDVNGFLGLATADGRTEDRRRGLRAFHEGAAERRKVVHALFEATPESWRTNTDPVAIRGSRLSLIRQTYRDIDEVDRPITGELLTFTEVNDNGLVRDTVLFDPDDIDAAFAELDARYLAGEAAPYSHTWSLLAKTYATLNRQELPPTTPDWVNMDHRRGVPFAPGDAIAYIRASWDLTPDLTLHIEAVHRLSNLGAVITHAAHGTAQEGFNAEWRDVSLFTFEGDEINRFEVFDKADLDTALVRFDELNPPALQFENAATRTHARVADAYNRRDLEGFLGAVTANARYDDRRKGLRNEGPVDAELVHAMLSAAAEGWRLTIEPIAIRGDHLALSRYTYRDADEADRPIALEVLVLTEVTGDQLADLSVVFDPDDINGAFAELTARWIASGEVAHPEVIEAARELVEAVNCHDWDAVAAREAGATFVNHRQLASGQADSIVDHWSSIRTMASLVPNMWTEVAEVLAHSEKGVVTTLVLKGAAAEGFSIELVVLSLMFFDGAEVIRMENFDIDQRDLALARFEQLNS